MSCAIPWNKLANLRNRQLWEELQRIEGEVLRLTCAHARTPHGAIDCALGRLRARERHTLACTSRTSITLPSCSSGAAGILFSPLPVRFAPASKALTLHLGQLSGHPVSGISEGFSDQVKEDRCQVNSPSYKWIRTRYWTDDSHDWQSGQNKGCALRICINSARSL